MGVVGGDVGSGRGVPVLLRRPNRQLLPPHCTLSSLIWCNSADRNEFRRFIPPGRICETCSKESGSFCGVACSCCCCCCCCCCCTGTTRSLLLERLGGPKRRLILCLLVIFSALVLNVMMTPSSWSGRVDLGEPGRCWGNTMLSRSLVFMCALELRLPRRVSRLLGGVPAPGGTTNSKEASSWTGFMIMHHTMGGGGEGNGSVPSR